MNNGVFSFFFLADIKSLAESFVKKGFVIRQGRSIHDALSILFLTTVVGAGVWHEDLLRNGLYFEWVDQPPTAYHERNNKSAMDHLDQLRTTVRDWEIGGFIERVSCQPLCCNPMTVAVQYNPHTGITKYRPCIDLSRHVNRSIKAMSTKLDDLSVAQELINQGDFMTAFDLENQFFQVKLHPDMSKFLGFMVPDELDVPVYYQFKVMPYGCKPAVSIVTRLLRPVKAFLHRYGVCLSVYVDDGRISATTALVCSEHMELTLQVVQLVGWNVQWKKTVLVPTQILLHLGFLTNTLEMRYYITPEKWAVVCDIMGKVLDAGLATEPVSVKAIASILGKLNSFFRSHGNIVKVMSRAMQHQLGAHVQLMGWTGSLLLSGASVQELAFLIRHLPDYNGCFIPTCQAASQVWDFSQLSSEYGQVIGSSVLVPGLAVVDPTFSHAYIYLPDGTFRLVSDVPNGFGGAAAVPVMRELALLTYTICQEAANLVAQGCRRLYWQSSSEFCCKCINHGSRLPAIQTAVMTLRRLERRLDFVLVPVFTPTCHPRVSTVELSRSTDEWSVDRGDLAIVLAALNFTPQVDCMASDLNAICAVFFSLASSAMSVGVDFFCQRLRPGVNYFLCSPVKVIPAAFHRIAAFPGVTALMLVPDWPSAAFWPILFPAGRNHRIIVSTHRFVPRFFSALSVPSLFTAGARVPMVALLIKT